MIASFRQDSSRIAVRQVVLLSLVTCVLVFALFAGF